MIWTEPQNVGIVGHEIDVEVSEPNPADDLILSRYRKALFVQGFLKLHPLRHAGQADDQIDIVGGPHFLQGDLVGDEDGG